MLDETPVACANIGGATEENGVLFKIDAAIANRAVLQLGGTRTYGLGAIRLAPDEVTT